MSIWKLEGKNKDKKKYIILSNNMTFLQTVLTQKLRNDETGHIGKYVSKLNRNNRGEIKCFVV